MAWEVVRPMVDLFTSVNGSMLMQAARKDSSMHNTPAKTG